MTALFSVSVFSKTTAEDTKAIKKSIALCSEIKKYVVKNEFAVECRKDYQHFNSNRRKNYNKSNKVKSNIKIAGYNLLNPGSLMSQFKDLTLVAKIMNKFDIIAGLELIQNLGQDSSHNKELVKKYYSNAKMITTHYRAPGYLKILKELRKLDSSWALILSPRGDAYKSSSIQEHVGFYYRSSTVQPTTNPHCSKYSKERSKKYACLPNLSSTFMDSNMSTSFSRRPFLGSFKSGRFDFALLASHVVFISPGDEKTMRKIVQTAFGENSYTDLGVGVQKKNYARFAEASMTMDFMNKYLETYSEQDLIFVSDMNLEKKEKFLDSLIKDYTNFKLVISGKTTTKVNRYSSSSPGDTGGLSKNYDHFLFDPNEVQECETRGTIHSYFKGALRKSIDAKYRIKGSNSAKMNKLVNAFKAKLKKRMTMQNGRLSRDEKFANERTAAFKKRVFLDQNTDENYYRLYKEVLSDHLPISINCSTTTDLD